MKKRQVVFHKLLCAALALLVVTALTAGCSKEKIENVIDKLPLTCEHPELVGVPAKAVTCTEDGNRAYWFCPDCRTYFLDAAGTAITTYQDVMLYSNGHKEEVMPAVGSTFTSTGLTEGLRCSECKEVLLAQKEVPVVEPGHFSITYNNVKGVTNSELEELIIYNERDGLEKLPNLSKEGYEFVGWYTEPGGKGTFMDAIKPGHTGNLKLYAHWEIYTYTIYLGGIWPKGSSLPYTVENKVDLPEPTEDGLTFAGWRDKDGKVEVYTDSVGVQRWRIPKGTTENIELMAQWKDNRNLVVPDKKSKKERYVNSGYDGVNGYYWFMYSLGEIRNVVLDPEGGLIKTDHKGGQIEGSLSLAETLTVEKTVGKSVSDTVSHTVTKSTDWSITESWEQSTSGGFDASVMIGAEIGPEFAKAKVEATFGVFFEESASTGKDNTMGGGNDETDENSKTIENSFAYSTSLSQSRDRTVKFDHDVAPGNYYYANVGTVKVYAFVVFDPVKGTIGLDTVSVLDAETTATVLSDKKEHREYVSDALSYDVDIAGINQEIADHFFVQYNANNGTNLNVIKAYTRDTDVQLENNSFDNTGHTFKKWETADGTEYDEGETVRNLAGSGQLITLNARWDPNVYSIKYDANTTSNVENLPGVQENCIYGSPVKLAGGPTRAGYKFEGWYRDPSCASETYVGRNGVIVKNLTSEPNGAVTLYAKWTANKYNVRYNANGGNGGIGDVVTYGQNYTIRKPENNITRAYYAFVGWSLDPNGKADDGLKPGTKLDYIWDQDYTLYAVWTPAKATWNNGLSDSNNIAVRNEGLDYYLQTNLDREALKAAGYTKVSIAGTIRGQRIYEAGAGDWYIDFYDRHGTCIHEDVIGKFNTSFETRNIQYTLGIECIRDDGTIKVRFDHQGGTGLWGEERGQYRIGLISITSTAQ